MRRHDLHHINELIKTILKNVHLDIHLWENNLKWKKPSVSTKLIWLNVELFSVWSIGIMKGEFYDLYCIQLPGGWLRCFGLTFGGLSCHSSLCTASGWKILHVCELRIYAYQPEVIVERQTDGLISVISSTVCLKGMKIALQGVKYHIWIQNYVVLSVQEGK